MKCRVVTCCEINGETNAPASIWDSLLSLSLLAMAGEGVISGIPTRNKCVSSFLAFLRALGFKIFRSAERVEMHYEEDAVKENVVFDAGCGIHTVALALAIASHYLTPPARLIVKTDVESLLNVDKKPLIELGYALGLRVWPGDSLSKLLIAEPTSPSPSTKPIVTGLRQGYALAAALLAAMKRGVSLYNRYGLTKDVVMGYQRVKTTINLLERLGVKLKLQDRIAKVEGDLRGFISIELAGSHESALTILALLSPCTLKDRLTINNIASMSDEDREVLLYLAKSMGYNIEALCTREKCSLEIVGKNEGFHLTYNIREDPDLLNPLIAYIAVKGEGSISGVASYEAELPMADVIGAVLGDIGLEAYLEEDGDRVIVKQSPLGEAASRRLIQCPKTPAPCLALLARSIKLCAGLIEGIEIVERAVPNLLEKLIELGAPLDVRLK